MFNITLYCWCVGEFEDEAGTVLFHVGTGWGQGMDRPGAIGTRPYRDVTEHACYLFCLVLMRG